MCGITGLYNFHKESTFVDKENVEKALTTLNKRGPDFAKAVNFKKITLGHARLSIIDTSTAAHQPFTDVTGRYHLVFNGEIFNYQALKTELISKGYKFTSDSDTEVLLYLFIEKGVACINQLNGFFAFVLYDQLEDIVYVGRDRYGIKPLVYCQLEDRFLFASEIKALLQYDIKKEIDYSSLLHYFHLNYIPGPHSIFANVKKIPPGNYGIIKENKFTLHSYYQLPTTEQNNSSNNYNESCKQLYHLMDDAVKLRLIADVPLGAFLSGGIDSSVITALAAKHTKHLNTFSIGFKDEPLFDETAFAKLVSEKCVTNHTVFALTNDDLYANLHDVLEYLDEPFADSSALNVHILSMHTKKYATVALSGDGADEMFGGYNKHAAEYSINNNKLGSKFLKLGLPLWNALPQSRNSTFGNLIRQFSKFGEGVALNPSERYWRWAGFDEKGSPAGLFNNKINDKILAVASERKSSILNQFTKKITPLDKVLLTDMQLVLANDMLTKVDAMSMANSLEVRTPFLDYRVVNFAFSIPDNYKIEGKIRKKILKDTFRKDLPEELFHRGKKGFEVPLLKWFKTDLKSMIEDDLLSEKLINEQQIFNYESIRKIKNQLYSNSPQDAVAKMWALIVFQYWWKKYFK